MTPTSPELKTEHRMYTLNKHVLSLIAGMGLVGNMLIAAGSAPAIAASPLLEKSLVPALILEQCLDETGGPLNSQEFTDCLTSKVIGNPETSPTGNPVHRPSTATVNSNAKGTLSQRDLITCESQRNRRKVCDLHPNRRENAALVRQVSSAPCIMGHTWGVETKGIWVDKGCRGIFYVGRTPSISPSYQRWTDRENGKGVVQPLPDRAPNTVNGWVRCALEYQVCKVPYPTKVRFGTPGQFNQREVEREISCTVKQFGNPDPNRQKACYYLPK
ncbi:DUF3011 domain-containing protein [Pseudovibrio exalbescens]|uniref:DUF3011 domain-containing protein n=1 Tax=Pseudovibrio exalbescens TaxID=197461 RepID=UPI000C99D256|nr:DUF3011 domain-containing protein [Pseudovibrio exalbescens]